MVLNDDDDEYADHLDRAQHFLDALRAFLDIEFNVEKLRPGDRSRFNRLLRPDAKYARGFLTRLLNSTTPVDDEPDTQLTSVTSNL